MHIDRRSVSAVLFATAIGAAGFLAPLTKAAASGNDWVSEMYAARLQDGMTTIITPDGRMRSVHVSDSAKMKDTIDMMKGNAKPITGPMIIMMIDGKVMIMEDKKMPDGKSWSQYMFGEG